MRYINIRLQKYGLCILVITKEKMALLTKSKEYKLATAQFTSTPYVMQKRMGGVSNWLEIKKKLEEVYSPIAPEIHAASDLHRKQGPDKTIQESAHNFTDVTEKVMGVDQVIIMNVVIIFLSIKNLYKNILEEEVVGVKAINTLADTLN